MIQSVQFSNFKALRDTMLPLGPFTLIVGPNGSGKSTALEGLSLVQRPAKLVYDRFVNVSEKLAGDTAIELALVWKEPCAGAKTTIRCAKPGAVGHIHSTAEGSGLAEPEKDEINIWIRSMRVYSLDAGLLAAPVELAPAKVINLMDALRQSVRGEQPIAKKARRSKKRAEGQREFLLLIPGKKTTKEEVRRPARSGSRRKAG